MLIIPPPCSFRREGNSCLAIQILPPTFQSVVSPFLGNVISLPHDLLVMSSCSSLPRSDFSLRHSLGLFGSKSSEFVLFLSSLTPPSSSWEDFDFSYPFKEFASLLISKVSTNVLFASLLITWRRDASSHEAGSVQFSETVTSITNFFGLKIKHSWRQLHLCSFCCSWGVPWYLNSSCQPSSICRLLWMLIIN